MNRNHRELAADFFNGLSMSAFVSSAVIAGINIANAKDAPTEQLVLMACVAVLGWATTRVIAEVERRAMPWVQIAES